MTTKKINKSDPRNADFSKIPKTIRDALFITQQDKSIVLDRTVSLAQFFSEVDVTKLDAWQTILEYNKFLFDRIDVLKTKIVHLQESNDFLRDEKFYLSFVNAEYIHYLKNAHVDVERIQRDARKKIEERKRQRADMEKQNPLAEIKVD